MQKQQGAVMEETTKERLQFVGGVLYFGLGLVQIGAVIDALQLWLGLPRFLSWILCPIIGFIPIINNILCFIGATKGFGWPWLWAAAFSFPFPIFVLVSLIVTSLLGKSSASR
jgi:hypothetical protein